MSRERERTHDRRELDAYSRERHNREADANAYLQQNLNKHPPTGPRRPPPSIDTNGRSLSSASNQGQNEDRTHKRPLSSSHRPQQSVSALAIAISNKLAGDAELFSHIKQLERKVEAYESTNPQALKSDGFQSGILARLNTMDSTIASQAKQILELKSRCMRQEAAHTSQRVVIDTQKEHITDLKASRDRQDTQLKGITEELGNLVQSTTSTLIRLTSEKQRLETQLVNMQKVEVRLSETESSIFRLEANTETKSLVSRLENEMKRLTALSKQPSTTLSPAQSPPQALPVKPILPNMQPELKTIHDQQDLVRRTVERLNEEVEAIKITNTQSSNNVSAAFDGLALEFDQLKHCVTQNHGQLKPKDIKTDVLEENLRRDISTMLRAEIDGIAIGIRNLDHRFSVLTTEHLAKEILQHLQSLVPAQVQLEARFKAYDDRLVEVNKTIDAVSLPVVRALNARAQKIEDEYKQFVGTKLGEYLGSQDILAEDIESLKARTEELEETLHQVQLKLTSTDTKKRQSEANGESSSSKRRRTVHTDSDE